MLARQHPSSALIGWPGMECPGQPAHWPGAAPKPDKKLANIRNLVGFRSKYTPQAAILCLKYNHYSAKERLLLGQWQGQCSSIQLETFPEKMRRVIVTIPGLGWALVCAAGLSSPELTPYIISSQARPCLQRNIIADQFGTLSICQLYVPLQFISYFLVKKWFSI